MKILVLSKTEFNNLMQKRNINNDNVSDKNLYIISINDTEGIYKSSYFDGCESENVLITRFDDTEEDQKLLDIKTGNHFFVKCMTEDQAKEIIKFLKKVIIDDNTEIIIHCTAGQNRSASVGKFCVDYFGYDMDTFKLDNPRAQGNSTVSRLLNNEFYWSHYK